MTVRRQPLVIIHDENAEKNRGMPKVHKSGWLKAQQPDLADRKTLSNITNKLKPLSNLGTATPIPLGKDNNVLNGKGAKARGGIVPQTPLGNITNVENSSKVQAAAMKEKKTQTKNLRMGPNPNYEVTEEMKQKAGFWAREGIERVHFTGKDEEALLEKMALEEVDRHVAQALSYRTEIPIPCLLGRSFIKDPPEIKDHLEIDPLEDVYLEDLYAKRSSFFHGMEEKVTHVDYTESYDEYHEYLDTLLTAPKDWWPTVV